MANICSYKLKIQGKKNACYAFFGSMPAYGDKSIIKESGTDDNYTMLCDGDCKQSVNCYCKPWPGTKTVVLPLNYMDAYSVAEDKYWYHTVKERSEMFQVEVWCNSGDGEDIGFNIFDDEDGLIIEEAPIIPGILYYEHYKNGIEIQDTCPEEIYLDDNIFECE